MQLIDAATDRHLWAETYDRELTVENLFAIQSEVSNAIARQLERVREMQTNGELTSLP